MTRLDTYLNFDGKSEEAFTFYKSVFGGEFGMVQYMKDVPMEGMTLAEGEENRIMHISLPISEHHVLMATDTLPSQGHKLIMGNNSYISVTVDSRAEADRMFAGLSEGGEIEMAMAEMFWGDYFGSFKDKYDVCWMVATSAKA